MMEVTLKKFNELNKKNKEIIAHLENKLNIKLNDCEKDILLEAVYIIYTENTISNNSLINAISIFDKNSNIIDALKEYPFKNF